MLKKGYIIAAILSLAGSLSLACAASAELYPSLFPEEFLARKFMRGTTTLNPPTECDFFDNTPLVLTSVTVCLDGIGPWSIQEVLTEVGETFLRMEETGTDFTLTAENTDGSKMIQIHGTYKAN